MTHQPAPRHGLLKALAVSAAAFSITAFTGTAQADVTAPVPPSASGDFINIAYGNGGDIYELQPYLFVDGLGGASAAATVAARNTALDFSFTSFSIDAHTLVLQYTLSNLSAVESFDQIRFMVFANPDGDPAVYADTVSETWGAALAGDPVRRETIALPTVDNIPSGFALNNNLTDGPPGGDCVTAFGCDATFALQWDAPTLAPGSSFVVQLGLSDDGRALSSRYLTATAVNAVDTALTFSGTGVVTVVPEPSAWALFLCGLIGLHGWARRRPSL